MTTKLTPQGILTTLQPRQAAAVMDLLDQAGIDTTPWHTKADGSPVARPRANPSFCYEWTFGGEDEPVALCIWHEHLTIVDEQIVFDGNLRALALTLDPIAIDRRNPTDVRNRARNQAKRAREFDSQVRKAYQGSKVIRAILLAGETRDDKAPGTDASEVDFRLLDPEAWYAHSYEMNTGSFRLIRGRQTLAQESAVTSIASEPEFVDQFDIPEPAEKTSTSGTTYPRSSEVRKAVLNRAKGKCECCGSMGFKMKDGSIFLETHHVIPLSEKGPDAEWNVAAICANDHREAHFGSDRKAIQAFLVEKLIKEFPAAQSALSSLLAQSN
ncbi:HNH endonuclease [Niveibacterium microcysteis]|uniref:HNH endonuclease n=1 Tax=Niveibacterium microcysteis TaxID=2811415 RepID=A0ABX7MD38_9RHOO|nr:HNH endonuclease [Niveibacterium microcysteis]QSI78778.1 HNH endonuclease [Niveibacterium microcysteis]